MSSTWFNPVVNLFGGRNGWLGRLYVLTTQEEAAERHRALVARAMRLEMDQEDAAKRIKQLERDAKRTWDKGDVMQSRETARQLLRARNEYARIGQRRVSVEAMTARLDEVRSGTLVEDTMLFYARAMTERMETLNPDRMTALLDYCAEQQLGARESEARLNEFFAAEQRVVAENDETPDKAVDDVLAELGCTGTALDSAVVRRIERLPAAPSTHPSTSDPPRPPAGGMMLTRDQ